MNARIHKTVRASSPKKYKGKGVCERCGNPMVPGNKGRLARLCLCGTDRSEWDRQHEQRIMEHMRRVELESHR